MLFDLALIPGLAVRDELITASEEAALIERIAGLSLTPFRFQGFTGKRLTTSFGWAYDFDHGRLAEADPIPDWLLAVRQRAAGFAGLATADLEQALVIRYDPGAGIGWHRDRPIFDRVVGVSRRPGETALPAANLGRVPAGQAAASAARRVQPERRRSPRVGAWHRSA